MALQCDLFGEGERKVIVLNDFSQDTSANDPIRPYLNQEEFTFAFLDLRGYGRSKHVKGRYNSSEGAADVRELADSLDWERFYLIGHSMAGMVVQRAMVDYPERLIKVIATTPVSASGLGIDDETLAFYERAGTDDEVFRAAIRRPAAGRYGEDWIEGKLRLNRATANPDAMQAYCSMWGREDFSGEVRGLKTPILVIYGKYDSARLNKAATSALFAEWYPNLDTYECPCEHHPMQQIPPEYAHIIQQYLRS